MFPKAFVTISVAVLLLASFQLSLGTQGSLLDWIRNLKHQLEEHPISSSRGKDKYCFFLIKMSFKKYFFSACKLHTSFLEIG